MRLLNNLRFNKLVRHSESSTTSGVGKEEFMDWSAMTQEQSGYYSALTMSRNLQGAGLTFRCRIKDPLKMFTLSMSGRNDQYLFEIGKRYKLRLQFDNSIVLYTYMHAYKQKHATIVDVSGRFLENILDSQNVKIEFIGERGNKITTKFSLKGASSAIESVIARSNEHKLQINSWFMSTAY